MFGPIKRNFINEEEYKDFTDPVIKYQFRTITTPIKGMYNIMNEVKSDLEYFSGMDYIVKTDVVQIIIMKLTV